MSSEFLVAALDIGSATTRAVIADVGGDLPRHPQVRILGVGQSRTLGLRRGVVSDIEETTISIRQAVQEAERMAGVAAGEFIVGIAGEHVRAMPSEGVVAINGEEIVPADVQRANEIARARHIPTDRELLHAIAQEYRVDQHRGIRDPVGMVGTRLETEIYLVTIGSAPAMNLRKSIEKAGYQVKGLVLEPLASALSAIGEEEKELGVAVVELGANSTELAVFHEGKIRHLASVAVGGNTVTSDLVHGLAVSHADADALKEAYGCAYEPKVRGDTAVIAIPASETQPERHVPRELMTHIVHQRMEELFELLQREMERSGHKAGVSAGVVLTGGGAQLDGVVELASDVFGRTVRIGTPRTGLGGFAEKVADSSWCAAVGMVIYGAHQGAAQGTASRRLAAQGGGVDKLASKVKTWFQDFF
ncbi:MAG: cell division protein FtsA [Gemmatimonadaceae bacterium]|jgi:cell division protein FtsA|nr:cell division protein FtsA [Gemmatimonadaceae bacterium]